jgi:hypothetical protein
LESLHGMYVGDNIIILQPSMPMFLKYMNIIDVYIGFCELIVYVGIKHKW